MTKWLNFAIKEKAISLAGVCFWWWNSFYSFLDSCGVSKSLQQQFPKEAFNKYQAMRNILTSLEERGDTETINSIVANLYRLTNAVDRDYLDQDKAKAHLADFRQAVGNDPIENEIKNRERGKARQATEEKLEGVKNRQNGLSSLNQKFLALFSLADMTPQERGYRLETLFFDLLQLNEFEYTPPYKTSDGEQIDGHFAFNKFDYLVEIKWTSETTKQKDLSIFDGKIRGKAQSTRGFFLSTSGFDDNAIGKYSGDSPRIVLMNGEDLALIHR